MNKLNALTLDFAASIYLAVIMMTSSPAAAQTNNLLQNPGFEQGTTGWFGFGAVSLSITNSPVHSGSGAIRVQNRTDTWNGVAQSVKGVLQAGYLYNVSAWVWLENTNSQTVRLTMQKVDGNGTSYQNIATVTASSNGWTLLSGTYTLAVSGTLTTLNLYMEGPDAGVNFFADDFAAYGYDWKAAANARIEQIRKRDVRLLVEDAAGNPLNGVSISVRQTRHRFAFGSAINYNIANSTYAAFFRTNFEWAVMENESKWYADEPTQGHVSYTAADNITNFCYTNGIILRGHCIFWAVPGGLPQWVTNLSNPDLLVAVTNRLNSAVNHFKGTFMHWDVNNEMLHGNFFGDHVGNWINPWMFQYAHALAPDTLLFVNDYNVVSGGETEAYKQQILNLLASNAPVQAIGAQGHFGSTVDPATTESRFDSLAQLGLPIWITEYDSLNADENVRADNLETLYRLAFSKQAVDGVLMWGFWAGSHWRGSNAAIVNLDWTLNAAGRRYQSLLAEWSTRTNGASDITGGFDFRGFHGSYDIVLTPPGSQPTLRRITLDPGDGSYTNVVIVNPTGSGPILHSAGYLAGNSQFYFRLSGDAGHTNRILTSTTLTDWAPWTNVYNPNGTMSFTYPVSTGQTRFFRAITLP